MTKDSSTERSYKRITSAAIGVSTAVILSLGIAAPASAVDSRGSEKSGSSTSAETAALRTDKFAGQVFDLMNEKRRQAGVPALTWNQQIADVSQAWANDLKVRTASPNFDWNTIHRKDAGSSLLPKGANWYGEIIAFNTSPQNVVNAWMNSPGHRDIMLDKRNTHAGVGFVLQTSGPYKGTYQVVSNLAGYPPNAKPPAKVSPFSDVTANHVFLQEMNWMFNKGISTGWSEPNGTVTYRPFESVRRDAMAAFMYRLAGEPAFTPPKTSPFVDVSVNTQFYKEISWLSSQGISNGWTRTDGKKEFRPLATVNRDAMAAFMYRLAGSPAYTPPSTSPFVDVPRSHVFYKEIAWMRTSGISNGWATNGKSEYRPNSPVARDAMAAFMKRWSDKYQ